MSWRLLPLNVVDSVRSVVVAGQYSSPYNFTRDLFNSPIWVRSLDIVPKTDEK